MNSNKDNIHLTNNRRITDEQQRRNREGAIILPYHYTRVQNNRQVTGINSTITADFVSICSHVYNEFNLSLHTCKMNMHLSLHTCTI